MVASTNESSLQSSGDPDDEIVQNKYLQIKIARRRDCDGCEVVQSKKVFHRKAQRGGVFLVTEMAETG